MQKVGLVKCLQFAAAERGEGLLQKMVNCLQFPADVERVEGLLRMAISVEGGS